MSRVLDPYEQCGSGKFWPADRRHDNPVIGAIDLQRATGLRPSPAMQTADCLCVLGIANLKR